MGPNVLAVAAAVSMLLAFAPGAARRGGSDHRPVVSMVIRDHLRDDTGGIVRGPRGDGKVARRLPRPFDTGKLEAPPSAATQASAAQARFPHAMPPICGSERGFLRYPAHVVKAMVDLVNLTPRDVVYEIGWSDGTIVLVAAEMGGRGVGFPLCPEGFRQARSNAERAKVGKRVTFHTGDVFAAEMRDASVVVLYWLPASMERLFPKLQRELKPGARIVSGTWNAGSCFPPEKKIQLSGPIKVLHSWTAPLRNTCGE